jgi:TonB-linked SusC/RagA family outer membrane protein
MEKLLRTFTVCLCFVLANMSIVLAQQKTIKGTVNDEKGIGLPGVTIRVKGTTIGTQTDLNGKFSLTVPRSDATIVISFIGYANMEMSASSSFQNLVMKQQAGQLSDVVVVAFAKQKAVTVTGAVSTVAGKELVSTSVANVTSMLVGNSPGISGLQASGEPGRNGANIYVRGVSTFTGGTNPLVVIDGIEQPAEQPFTQLNAMDANEIENVSVLKDAASTAVFGIRGANGVIIVSTKRGRAGKPVLSFSTNFGFTKATNYLDNVNSYDYALFRNEAIRTEISSFGNSSYNNYLFTPDDLWKFQNNRDYTPAQVAAMTNLSAAQRASLNNSPALYYTSHNLYKDQFGGTGPQQQYNLNISGGTQKVKYFTSVGYFNQGSILTNTNYYGSNTQSNFNRYNFRSNFDIDVVKNFQISVNLAGQFGTTTGPGSNAAGPNDLNGRYKAIMQYIFDGNPFISPGIVNGHLVNAFAGVDGTADNPLGPLKSGSSIGNQNAVYNLLTSGHETLYNTLLSNSVKLTHTMNYLTKGLTATGTASYDDYYVKSVSYNPSLPVYSVRRDHADPNLLDFYGGAVANNSFNNNPGHNSTWHKTYFDAGLNYNRAFGPHTITALLLGKASLYSIPYDANNPANNANTPSGIMGLLSRVTYNYKERYLIEADLGYNGTEQFAPGKRFGYFPAYSAGWVASNESFFPQNKIVTFVKFRGSYGEVGNDQLNQRRYLYFPNTFNINQSGYYFGNTNGSAVNPYYAGSNEGTIGNPNVTWERAKKLDFGLELRFLSDKLSFTADYFNDKRNNILTSLGTIPTTYGVPSASVPPVNVGVTTNHGYEIVLGWTDKIGQVGYNITGNVNYARNKIVYKAEAPNPYPWMNQTGYAIGQYKGLVSDGFFNTPEQLANRPYNTYTSNVAALGDIRYKDINGDGKIDNKDMVPIGYSNLPQYNYSLKIGFNYKGFDVSSLFYGTAKGSFYMPPGMVIPFFKNAGNAFQWEYDGRWTPEKAASGATITYPRAVMNGTGSSNDFLTSDFWLLSNNFIKLKNVEVGYTIPRVDFLRRGGISSIRVYANGNNLFTWGNKKALERGIDPETSQDINNQSTYLYPITRVVNFGANVRF